MESGRFDDLVRALGHPASRRAAAGGVLALLVGGRTALAGRRRCRKDSPAGQCCRERQGIVTCTCDNGGLVCGDRCCTGDDTCRDGLCVAPEPPACLAFGAACKGSGRECCGELQCASGQGGAPPACLVPAGGACARTADCVYGASCAQGACVVERVCDAKLGDTCTPGSTFCCAGSCGPTAPAPRSLREPRAPNTPTPSPTPTPVTPTPIPRVNRCCVPLDAPCAQDAECCCEFGTSLCFEGACGCA